ncbi:MAG: M13 family metallopeptidase [Bacteroidetes bacterium]|nr:M13 family metallopeptidase [Bacteroidota bacterium]
MNNKLFTTAIAGLVAINLIVSCTPKNKQNMEGPAINIANMDTTVRPGDDFYHYANGTWMKNNPIPADNSRWGAFETLMEENYKQLQTIMTEAASAKDAKEGSVQQKIGDFYNSGMDTVSIEKTGIKAIQPELDKIAAIKTPLDVQKHIAYMQTSGMSTLFYFYAAQDEKNSNAIIGNFYQGGLGLPDRDYYLSPDPRSTEIRKEYVKHITKMFELTGETKEQSAKIAEQIMLMETQLANVSSTRVALRDPVANYNKTNLDGLKKNIAKFDWSAYFEALGLTKTEDINVGQPKFISEMAAMTVKVPVELWKTYFKWHLLSTAAPYLSDAFVKENFAFNGTVMRGVTEMKPRWKRVLNETSGSLGEAVGQLYVEKYFPAKAKQRMIELCGNLKAALKDRILNLKWMSDVTKKEAIAKLEKINVKVGYPDKWIDYSKLKIAKTSYYENISSASRFEFARQLAKIGKPVDRAEWGMTPQTINAYYSPNMNEIVFPAGILQPPFFFMNADDAVNYGAIGAIIGHEMTHGFDDQGRQYDKEGNLRDWWIKEDAVNFGMQTKVLVDQYNNFKILDSLHVDGNLTLGENIADMGGVTVAFAALQKAMQGKENKAIDGFTPEQRFFLSYAQVWRCNVRDKETMSRLKEDVHSPAVARVNAIVYNIPQFYQAFSIQPTDKRFKPEADRAVIW